MKKKTFIILILPVLALVAGYFLREVFATSNPHTWDSGLVGYWSFDGQHISGVSVEDESVNSNTGTMTNGVGVAGGVVGQALSFDGVDDYVAIPHSASLNITDAISIEMWVKRGEWVSASWDTILDKGVNTAYMLRRNSSSDTLRFDLFISGTLRALTSPTFPVDTWWHTVGTFDGTTMNFYINSVPVTPASYPGTIGTNGTQVLMGMQQAGQRYFNGLIDEVRVYNRALSADEVKQHYEQTRRNLQINQPSGTPPVGWWKMDEATGATVRDYSVNANNGTVSNGGYGATSTDGQVGKALQFDGVDDSVSTADIDITGDLTVGVWVKVDTANHRMIVIKRDNGDYTSPLSFSYNVNSHLFSFGLGGGGTDWSGASSGISPNSNQWYHVVGVVSGTTITVYTDGVAGTSATFVGTRQTNDRPIRIGGSYTYGKADYMFNGIIDDVRIYNYARSADQIADDYRAGAYRTIIASSVPSDWWTDGLVGYWNFDGKNTTTTSGALAGTRDVSGNGNWGTFNGGVKPKAGIVGQALSFDGVNDYVDAGSEASLDITGAITVELWVKFNAYFGANPDQIVTSLINKDTGSGDRGWIIANNTSYQLMFRISKAPDTTVADTVVHDLNVWYHVVGTYDGSFMRLYKNGIQVASVARTGEFDDPAATLFIGTAPWGYFLNGFMDEVRIYNRALSAEEIKMHYEQSRRNLRL